MTGSASIGAASRPEKRVTARSSVPQNRCTGLTLPWNRAAQLLEDPVRPDEGQPEAVDGVAVERRRGWCHG